MSPRSGGGTSGRDFHARAFNQGRWQIITAGGAGIGMLDVEYRPAGIYLARIEIRPGHPERLRLGPPSSVVSVSRSCQRVHPQTRGEY